MKQYKMLGVNTEELTCCVLKCQLPFDEIINEDIESFDFIHDCAGWNGRDPLPRVLNFISSKLTGRKIKLKNNISFHGTDTYMEQDYNWTFTIDEIRELE